MSKSIKNNQITPKWWRKNDDLIFHVKNPFFKNTSNPTSWWFQPI